MILRETLPPQPSLFHQEIIMVLSHDIEIGSEAWFLWVEERTMVRLKSSHGCFTLQRPSKMGMWYIYYEDCRVSMIEVVGKTEHLTPERLLAVMRVVVMQQDTHLENFIEPHKQNIHTVHNSYYPLISAKTLIPDTPPHYISRSRLIEQINNGRQCKLTLVSAPAGYGKTTLLSEWSSYSTYPVCWISVNEEDNDLRCFYSDLLISLKKLNWNRGQSLQDLLHSVKTLPVELLLPFFLEILGDIESEFALTLDDYNVIDSLSIHQTIASLLMYGPSTMHIVIASRKDPPLPLARLYAIGQLTTIRTAELQFTIEEMKQFFARVVKVPYSSDALTSIYERTEGWVTGLYFAELLLQEYGNVGSVLNEFSGTHHYVFDYLMEEVFQSQPEQMQQFLLYTSLVPDFNASLAQELTGLHDCQLLLETSEKENLFLLPLDRKRQSYRYHQLFRDFLSYRLQQDYPTCGPKLSKKICQWYIQNGQFDVAVEQALHFQLYDQATTLIAQLGNEMLQTGNVCRLSNWITALPHTIQSAHPSICLMQAWIILFTKGADDTVNFWLSKAERYLNLLKANRVKTQMYVDIEAFDTEVSILRTYIATLRGEKIQSAAPSWHYTSSVVAEKPFLRAIALLHLGNEKRMNGHYEEAMTFLKEARFIGHASGQTYIEIMAMWNIARFYTMEDHLDLSAKLYEEAIDLAERSDPLFPHIGKLYIGLAKISYEWNELKSAQQYIERGIERSEQLACGETLLHGYIILSYIKQAMHMPEQASEISCKARFLMQKYHLPIWFDHFLKIHEVRLLLMQGQVRRVASWKPTLQFSNLYALEQLTYARLLLQQGRTSETLVLLDHVLIQIEKSYKKHYLSEIYVMQSIAHYKGKKEKSAIAALTHALILAEKGLHIRLFVNEESAIATLFPKTMRQLEHKKYPMLSSDVSREFFHKILDEQRKFRTHIFMTNEDEPAKISQPEVINRLSEREIEVMRYVALGLSGPAIAQCLVVAESTVKWHIKNIYSKLHVHNRAQVIIRAKALNII